MGGLHGGRQGEEVRLACCLGRDRVKNCGQRDLRRRLLPPCGAQRGWGLASAWSKLWDGHMGLKPVSRGCRLASGSD